MSSQERSRPHLPIPDRPRTGLITCDAKDPETKCFPIDQLRPPKGAPSILVIVHWPKDIKADSSDHLVSPEDAVRIAMARQQEATRPRWIRQR